jgi:uncharacterized protein YndB with AHSA1/START domain
VASTQVEQSIEIGRPVEQVFALISDPRNDPSWCPKVLSCDQIAGEGRLEGARFRAMHRPIRLRPAAELEIEIVAVDPPRSMSSRQEDEDGVFNVTYELEPSPGGTRLTQRSDIEWKIPRPLQLVGNRTVPRHIKQQMEELKRVLEA